MFAIIIVIIVSKVVIWAAFDKNVIRHCFSLAYLERFKKSKKRTKFVF